MLVAPNSSYYAFIHAATRAGQNESRCLLKSLFSRVSTSLVLAGALAIATVLPASADIRSFTVWNNTGTSIAKLFVSPFEIVDWGDDVLGTDVLSPDEGWEVMFDRFDAGKCLYDIKVITKDGNEVKAIGVDLCAVSDVTFNKKSVTQE